MTFAKPKSLSRCLILFGIYSFINTLFIYKYSDRINDYCEIIALTYFLVLLGLHRILKEDIPKNLIHIHSMRVYPIFIIVSSILLLVLMSIIDPNTIRVARYIAINEWTNNFINGVFPYGSDSHPSGFPFLFVLVMPFYFLGNAGLMQVFSYILFSWIVHRKFLDDESIKLKIMILLFVSPIFLYEVAVRSELFSNMTIVLAFLFVSNLARHSKRKHHHIIIGFVGGLILSTRGIVLIIFLVFFIYQYKNDIFNGFLTLTVMGISFIATLVPFYIWDSELFWKFGPLAIQASYIPTWLLVIILMTIAIYALKTKALKEIYFSIPIILFAVILIMFIYEIAEEGFEFVIFSSGFDISYFAFPIVFLLPEYIANNKKLKFEEC